MSSRQRLFPRAGRSEKSSAEAATPLQAPTVPRDRPSGMRLRSEGVDLRCDLASEDRDAILALAGELGRLAADLWFDGKLDALPACEEPDEEDE